MTDTLPPADGPRPVRWEDDLSANAADTAPFENARPIAEWDPSELKAIQIGNVPRGLADLPLLELAARDTYPLPVAADRENYSPGNDPQYWLWAETSR